MVVKAPSPSTTREPIGQTACRAKALVWLLLWLALTPLIAGCRGCASDDGLSEEEREAKREELTFTTM